MLNQKGFATFEIILVLLIISLLAGVALPKMARILDVATLDYEVRKFHSEFIFAKSLSKSATYNAATFSTPHNGKGIQFEVRSGNYKIKQDTKIIHENNLQAGFEIACPQSLQNFSFNPNGGTDGKSGTFQFISPQNNNRYVILDSVGRLRGSRTEN